MKPASEDGTKARVLAAALRNWATVDADMDPTVARLEVRQPPTWAYAATVNISDRQYKRVLAFLRDDLIENRPGYSTPERAADVVEALLQELLAAGRICVTTADLVEAVPRIGRSRTWIAAHITELIDSGRLRETRRTDTFNIA
ncbi:hypothetical protein [Streptomyces noursei]|uniref:hypothetical protein n=1 Tax=Streptomyces noursei TaxID=1971 RepID=UPI001674EAAC|nr:hypothetical protein [Streptomyces noursei]MCZ1013970.1 hypothetical protein [Streptomyces noursei]GGX40497.1 hypothetical protein GCM10010341_73030 [Streptomyces noursei]